MVELNSFGSVLSYAIDLESRLRDHYRAVGHDDLAGAADKNRQKLERVRRENVVEITLEPIEGLDAADYALDLSQQSAALEALAAKFYADIAPKINVKAAQRALEQIGRSHAPK